MKKFLTISAMCLLCIILATTFVACVPPGGGGGGGGGGEIPVGNEWWTTTGELHKNEDGTVNFEHIQIDLTSIVTGEDEDDLTKIVNDFNTAYNGKIKINLDTVNQGEYDTTVSRAIANKTNAPQLLMFHQKSVKAFADNKLLQPFNEALEKSGIDIKLTDYSDGLAKHANMGYNDYIFGLPADAQSCVVLVNKKLLNKYVDDGVVPTTREDLFGLLEKVKTGENTQTAVSWATGDDFFSTYVFITSLLQNGVNLFNEQNYRADWSSADQQQAFQNGIKAIDDFVKKGYAKYNQSTTASYDAFYNDKALFLVCMPWDLELLAESYRSKHSEITADADISTFIGATSLASWFALDGNATTKDLIYGDSHFFAMSKHVTSIEDKAAICEFIRYFTQETSVAIDWGKVGHLGAYVPVVTSETYTADSTIANFTSKFYGSINNFRTIGVTPYHAEFTSRLSTLFNSVANGESDYATLISAAQRQFNEDVDIGEMAG